MELGSTPRWLARAERYLGWLAVPRIAVLIVTLQAAGFLMVSSDPIWIERLALIPPAVLQGGEYWRLITWLALPLSMSPFWVIFVLWFLWFIINAIEDQWGAFRTTFYIVFSMVVTIAYSLATGFPVTQASHFQSTLFLAAAALFPEYEVLLFFVLPVRLKWLALLTLAFLGWEFLREGWIERFHMLSVLSGYILFFGPASLNRVKLLIRRKRMQGRFRP